MPECMHDNVLTFVLVYTIVEVWSGEGEAAVASINVGNGSELSVDLHHVIDGYCPLLWAIMRLTSHTPLSPKKS
jgi:hypothetical protein